MNFQFPYRSVLWFRTASTLLLLAVSLEVTLAQATNATAASTRTDPAVSPCDRVRT